MNKNITSHISRRLTAITTVVLISLTLASCVIDYAPRDRTDFRNSKKWGKVIKENIDLDKFVSIENNAAVDIIITQGDKMKVEVEGNEKAINAYSFTVEEEMDQETGEVYGKLVCEFVDRYDFKTPSVRLYVTMPSLKSIGINGSGEVNIFDTANFTDYPLLALSIDGSGDISAQDLQCNNLKVCIDGSGDVGIRKLECLDFTAQIYGSGDIDFRRANADNANFTIEASGDIDGSITTKGNIKTLSNGSGDIDLDVDCDTISINSQGSGDIEIEGTANVLKKYRSALGGTDTKKLRAHSMIWGDE